MSIDIFAFFKNFDKKAAPDSSEAVHSNNKQL